jgi:hypothetical protein
MSLTLNSSDGFLLKNLPQMLTKSDATMGEGFVSVVNELSVSVPWGLT